MVDAYRLNLISDIPVYSYLKQIWADAVRNDNVYVA